MSSVSAISGVSSLWDTSKVSSTSSSAADTYAQLVNSLQSGNASGGSSGSSDDTDTVTITKVMPDGSLLIMVLKGETMVSEHKVSGASTTEQQNLLAGSAAQTQVLDHFNDTSTSTSIAAGSLFSASV